MACRPSRRRQALIPKVERPRKPVRSLAHQQLLETRIAELKSLINKGGLRSTIRGLLYVGMARGKVDERGALALRQFRLAMKGSGMTLAQYKQMAREQYFLLLLEPERVGGDCRFATC